LKWKAYDRGKNGWAFIIGEDLPASSKPKL
jgi:hypothetical protein